MYCKSCTASLKRKICKSQIILKLLCFDKGKAKKITFTAFDSVVRKIIEKMGYDVDAINSSQLKKILIDKLEEIHIQYDSLNNTIMQMLS